MEVDSKLRDIKKLGIQWRIILTIFYTLGILLTLNQLFNLRLGGFLPISNSYLYLLLAFYLSPVFILYSPSKSGKASRLSFFVDVSLFALTFLGSLFLSYHGVDIIEKGWELSAPFAPTFFSILLWIFLIEAVRRTGGLPIMLLCLLFSIYPIYANYLPGFLKGIDFDFITTARNHIMSSNSVLGIPLQVFGNLIIGFILFGIVLQATGAGEFFLNIANALLGQARGGPAKVAIVASALFGTLSGSAVSNVITTGSMTIPAMKKTGYEPHYAGAIEACASTGGTIMPPIMGAAAFVMASFLGIPYYKVCIAAAIPSILYYLGLFFQADAHAFKIGLKGIPKSETPSLKETLKDGWYYVFSILTLFYFLFTLKVEAWAPFYASAVLIVLSLMNKKKRITPKTFIEIIWGSGRTLTEIITVLAAVGLIVGALSITGVAFAFSRELVALVGQNLILILLVGALTSFILGFGMTSTACYIFLAIVMAPALINMGVSPIAAHLFVLYWGVVSFITPPVALAAYAGATLAGADFMKTGITAMRLGIITYFIPFMFVYNTVLVGEGGPFEVIYALASASFGIFCISMALEGVIIYIGKINFLIRALLIIGGPMMVMPGWKTDLAGFLICGISILIGNFLNKNSKN